MLSLGERIAGELGRGLLDQVVVRGAEGYVILSAVGEDAVLTVLTRKDAKLGLVFPELRRAAEDLVCLIQVQEGSPIACLGRELEFNCHQSGRCPL